MTESMVQSILDEGQQEEGSEDEGPTIEDDFKALDEQATEVIQRVKKISQRFVEKPETPVTHSDLAILYGLLSGDMFSLVQDVIRCSGAAFSDTLAEISGDDDGEQELGEDVVQYYTTMKANAEAFYNLSTLEGIPSEQKEGFKKLLEMNNQSVARMDEQYGEELAKASQQLIAEAAKEVSGGAV